MEKSKKVRNILLAILGVLVASALIFTIIVINNGFGSKKENKPNPNIYYRVTFEAAEGGAIKQGNYKVPSVEKIINSYSDIEITAVPDENYKFAGWSDGDTNATKRSGDFRKDQTVYAYFHIDPCYTVTYSAEEGGYITGETNQIVYEYKDSISVTATPIDDNHVFVRWSDGSTNPTRQESRVNKNQSYTAYFNIIFAAGTGVEDDPYMIRNQSEYDLFLSHKKSDTYYKLKENISIKYSSIGYFSGHIDFNNNVISSFSAPLFSKLYKNATVKNVTLTNKNISFTEELIGKKNDYYAIFAKTVEDNVTLTNCTIQNSSISLSPLQDDPRYFGIFFAETAATGTLTMNNCTVSNCSITVGGNQQFFFENSSFYAGGMIGISRGMTLNFNSCQVSANFSIRMRAFGADDLIPPGYEKYMTTIYCGDFVGYHPNSSPTFTGCTSSCTTDLVADTKYYSTNLD